MTTIIAVKKGDQVAIAGDGQVTMGEKVIMKHRKRSLLLILSLTHLLFYQL